MQDAIVRFGSVDWAANSHAACIVDASGHIVDQFSVDHTAAGLATLVRQFQRQHVARVAIERPDGPVVEALLVADLEVVVVSSRAVKGLRTRYGLAGNKADRSDAYILADCLRTDGHRWASLQPDAPETLALRASVRSRKDLVATRVATANQLRAHLQLVFPAAVSLFAAIDSPIMLRFLARFPSADKAAWLSERRVQAWLQANAYSGRRTPSELLERLRTAPKGVHGATAEAQAVVTLSLVRVLRVLVAEIAVGGWLMDRLGRRIMFLGTMVMFIPLALAQAFAPHMETLALFGQHRSRNARGPVSITYSACATELLRSAVSARGANLGQLAGGDRQPAPRLV